MVSILQHKFMAEMPSPNKTSIDGLENIKVKGWDGDFHFDISHVFYLPLPPFLTISFELLIEILPGMALFLSGFRERSGLFRRKPLEQSLRAPCEVRKIIETLMV